MTPSLAPPKNWANEALGLFVTADIYRTDGVVDLEAWTWVEHANCIGSDPELFFVPGKGADVSLLTQICGGCAVQFECLQHALDSDEEGWWGGTSSSDRRHLLKVL